MEHRDFVLLGVKITKTFYFPILIFQKSHQLLVVLPKKMCHLKTKKIRQFLREAIVGDLILKKTKDLGFV